MLPAMVDTSLIELENIRPLSRKEYDRLVELGFFDEDPHVELLEGVLVKMSPQGGPHSTTVSWLTTKLARLLPERYAVRPGCPFAASDWSEPEPDLAIIEADWTKREHPTEVLLLVEVSVSSLRMDRITKLTIYAKAGVPEYWVVDVNAGTVEVYTEPRGRTFHSKQVLHAGDVLRPTLLSDIAIPVADIPF